MRVGALHLLRLRVRGAHRAVAGVHLEVSARLGVDEPRHAEVGELALAGIVEHDAHDVVALAQAPQRALGVGRHPVGDDEDDGVVRQQPRRVIERSGQVGARSRAGHASTSRTSRSAWRRPLRGGTTCSMPSEKSTRPTRSLLRVAVRASTAASSADSDRLSRSAVPKRARARAVHQQQHGELALLDVALDEETAHARGDVPVDGAHLVARLVFAHLGELHSLPLEHRVVLAGEAGVHQAARAQLDALDLAQDLGRDAGVCRPEPGGHAASGRTRSRRGDGVEDAGDDVVRRDVTLSASAS